MRLLDTTSARSRVNASDRTPAGDRPSKPLGFGRTRVGSEVDTELGHELDGQFGVGDLVDASDHYLSHAMRTSPFGSPAAAKLTQ